MSDVVTRLVLQEDMSAKFSRISSAARSTAAQVRQAGQQIDNAFKSNSPAQFAANLGNAMDAACQDADALGSSLGRAMDDLGRGASDAGRDLESAVDNISELADAVDEAGESIDDLSDSAERLGENVGDIGGRDNGLSGLSDDAEEAGESMGNAETKANSLGSALKKLFAIVSVAAIASQVSGFARDSIAIGQGYTSMMSEVQSLSGASGSDLALLETTAREYGATTVFSATEAAEALKYMSLAGWDAQQSASALGGVLDLAASSGMGLGQASDMVTDYLSAFGMEAQQSSYFADMLAYAQANSNTTAEQLGEAFRNSAANLNAAGQDVETVTSMLEGMANQGYKGSEAGTALTAVMRDITNKMDDGAIKIGKTSIAVQDAQGNFRDLTDILMDVETAVGDMGDAERAAALSSTFTADSTKGLNLLLNEGMANIAGYEEALRGAGGAAGDMAATMNDNLAGDMANMNSAFEEMQLQVFEQMEGPLREGAQYITSEVIPALTEWVPDAFGTVADGAAKIGNALKPLFETILKNPKGIGTALASLGTGLAVFKGATAISGITTSLEKLGAVITAHPWAAGAAAVAAGVIAIKGAIDQYNEIQIDESLERHFGNIELSEPEISDLAGRIIGVDWVANINLALGEFENAEEFYREAEQALQNNKILLWKAGVRTTLERAEGNDPVSPFVQKIQELLDGKEDNNGLSYLGNVEANLEANGGDDSTLVQSLVDFANAAVTGAEAEELEQYAKDVAMELTPNGGDDSTLVQALVDFANGVIDGASAEELQEYVDTVNTALGAEEGDKTFESALTTLLAEVVVPDLVTPPVYEDTVSVVLTPEQQDQFKENIETYLVNKQQELESLTFAAKTSMETVLGEKAGSALISQMQTWAAEDSTELNNLSSSLTAMVQGALEDGVLDVEEQAAIEILQTKINNILSGWKEAQADAEWQTLQMKWSGKDLTSDSFTQLMTEAHKQRETAMEALDADTTSMNAVFNGWLNSGKITQEQRDQIGDLWANNYRNMEGEAMGRALSFGSNSLQDAYGDLLDENRQRLGNDGTIDRLNAAASEGDWSGITDSYSLSSNRDFYSKNGGADRKALLSMYESMKPDVSDMGSLLDSYRSEGMKVPQALLDSYNQAIEIGAAAGDTDAAWQQYANSILESGNKELISALSDESNPMYETLRSQMAPELAEALDRAIYASENSVESADLSELFNTILGLDDPAATIDLSRLSELCEKYGLDISDYLAEKGIEVDGSNTKMELKDFDPSEAAQYSGLTATGNMITLDGGEIALEYEVNTNDTLSGIAEKTGVALEELKAANQQIFDERGTWDLIYEGDLIYIPNVQVDTSNVAAEAGQAAEEAASEAGNAAGQPVSMTVSGDVTVDAETVDTSQVTEATGTAVDDAFETPILANGQADVTIAKNSDNISALYNEVGDEIKSAFSVGYAASGTVDVTLTANYDLANPVSTLTFGGAATGSYAITAALHADGGRFDEPHLGMVAEAGYPEWIIPMDGSADSRGMVLEAAGELGMLQGMSAGGSDLRPSMPTQEALEPTGSNVSGTKTINVNVNGSGNMKISGDGMSKEKIVDLMMEHMREIFMNIVQQEIIEEGTGTYEW